MAFLFLLRSYFIHWREWPYSRGTIHILAISHLIIIVFQLYHYVVTPWESISIYESHLQKLDACMYPQNLWRDSKIQTNWTKDTPGHQIDFKCVSVTLILSFLFKIPSPFSASVIKSSRVIIKGLSQVKSFLRRSNSLLLTNLT